jgi:HEAT repeat protein
MLIRALSHRLSDRRILAAEILGRQRSRAATPRLAHLALEGDDPYLQASAARALAAIEPDHPLVGRLRTSGPILVQAAMREDGSWH